MCVCGAVRLQTVYAEPKMESATMMMICLQIVAYDMRNNTHTYIDENYVASTHKYVYQHRIP